MDEEIYPNPNPSKDALRYVHLVSSSGIDFEESQRYYREWAVRYDQEMNNIRYRGPHYAVDLLLDYINNCTASQRHPNTTLSGSHRAAATYQRRHSSFMTKSSIPPPSPSARSVAAAGDSAKVGTMLTPLASAASHDDVDVVAATPVRVADVGCGTGLVVDQLQYRLSSEGQLKLDRKLQIDGLDCSAAMLEHMPKDRRKVYNKLVCKRIDVDVEISLTNIIPDSVVSDASESQNAIEVISNRIPDLDFGKYDIAVACNTFSLNHFDPRRGVDALCRLVRAGGYVIIVMRAYATSADELHYFKQALERMTQLERNGQWRRVWCSTALDMYDLSASNKQSASSQSGAARRASSVFSSSNSLLRPAKLLVYCKAQQPEQFQLPSSRRSARKSTSSASEAVAEVLAGSSRTTETLAEQIEPIALK